MLNKANYLRIIKLSTKQTQITEHSSASQNRPILSPKIETFRLRPRKSAH